LLIEHTRPGIFHAIDRAVYRTAAMTGLRRGELLALRWCDVDWLAHRVRVRQNYVRVAFGTPKSKRSTLSVPMALEVAAELERLSQTSRWCDDEDLVFAHPATGEPLYVAGIQRRMRKAMKAAGLDQSHVFHGYADVFVMPTSTRGSGLSRSFILPGRHNATRLVERRRSRGAACSRCPSSGCADARELITRWRRHSSKHHAARYADQPTRLVPLSRNFSQTSA
jgi:integrase